MYESRFTVLPGHGKTAFFIWYGNTIPTLSEKRNNGMKKDAIKP